MSVKILCDSSCDLPDEILESLNIGIIPLKVSFENGETFLDRTELSPKMFAAKMRSSNTLPKTSTPDPATFIDVFTRELHGADQVLLLCISSELSSTCQTANVAAAAMASERVRIYDSKSVSLGLGILAVKAAHMADRDLDADEIIEQISRIRQSSEVIFTLDTLENIVKGGRLKKHEGIMGNLLNIKPILRASNQGLIEVMEKARGRKKAVKRMLDMVDEYAGKSASEQIFGISHLNCLAEAEELAKAIKQRYQPREEIIIGDMGSTIGTYTGEGALSICF